MSFFVILALLFCFDVQGSYPAFGEFNGFEGSGLDLDFTDEWDKWKSWLFYGSYPMFEDENDFDVNEYEYLDFMDDGDEFKSRIYNGSLSPVNLTVDSVSNSSDSCKLSVTCSTEYFDINSTFTCDTKTCYQEGGEQRETAEWSSVSLHVYLSDGFIICNHSNQVNWTNDMTEIRHFCPQHAGSNSPSDGFSICRIKTVVFSVGLIIMVSAVIGVHVIEKLKN